MVVKNECQALCIAVEMERRAIRVYERALMLAQDAQVRAGIEEILADERRHLQRFSAMRECRMVDEAEERLLISSMAAEVLFTGGVMEMKREQALTTLKGLYQYAADSEEILADERRHLQRFSAMRECRMVDEAEERLLISSMAAEVLFTGGVMEMKREQALTTLRGLYQYAADSEADAVRTYADFAKKCADPAVHDVFMDIVREESSHLVELRGKLAAM